MRFTIERLRTLVLAAGVLLVGSLILFLARGKLRNPLNLKELPQRLGVNIQSDATTFTIDHAFGGHSRYRIHAAKAVQYKNNRAILKDVQIDLYGEDGSSVDRIEGAEFEYDQKNGTAIAAGPVEITLTRPGIVPAVAPSSIAGKMAAETNKATPIASLAQVAKQGQIHVKTSGLTFDTKSGVAMTAQRVDFSMAQGNGSSIGASYDAKGALVLDRAVELNTIRDGQTVAIHAQHAEFERASLLCRLHAPNAVYRGGEATAGDANVLFRDDGSAIRLDATNGFNLQTATGGRITAPIGSLEFDEHNQPRHGHLQGGVKMDSTQQTGDGSGQRRMHAVSPVVELEFTAQGDLRRAHLERGVEMQNDQVTDSASGSVRLSRTWQSPLADIDFRDDGHGHIEPAAIHGSQGVVVTGQSQHGNAAPEPSRLSADEVKGEFGPNSALAAMTGSGHATLEQTNAVGTRQSSTGDRFEAHFAPSGKAIGKSDVAGNQNGAGQIQSAIIDGHVVLTQIPAAFAKKNAADAPAPLRAWAGRATYDGPGSDSSGDWLHLTLSPRLEVGGLQMTADKLDLAHQTGDAYAHGNVKATWIASARPDSVNVAGGGGNQGTGALGGQGPAHIVAAEARLSRPEGGADSEAIFQGHARLWQQANSVSAPMIVLDRQKQTLVAHSADPSEPVRIVLLSTGAGAAPSKGATGNSPSVIRVRSGDLKYSDAERKAVMSAGALGAVVAETPTASTASNSVELVLLPAGNHAGKDGAQAQVDRMTARGHVQVASAGRHGTGEQLLYTGETGEYVLTGTAAAPPIMTDPLRGTVSGDALIFHSHDDRVSIEGGGNRTTTQTSAPK